jgi:hypothetical protein
LAEQRQRERTSKCGYEMRGARCEARAGVDWNHLGI